MGMKRPMDRDPALNSLIKTIKCVLLTFLINGTFLTFQIIISCFLQTSRTNDIGYEYDGIQIAAYQ